MDPSPDRTTADRRPSGGRDARGAAGRCRARQYDSERARWELAKEAGEVGTFDFEPATGLLLWDEQLQRMFGYDPATFDQSLDAFTARVHPDDERWHADALQASVDTMGEYDVEYRIVLPGGETRWIHARGRHLPGPDGRTDHLIGAAYDTTGEREASTRVTRVLEAMPAGFYSLDREWRFTHVNAEAERLLGPQPRRAAGQGPLGGLPRHGRQRLRGELPQGGRAPGSRSPSTRTTPPRWTAGTSCAPGPPPTGCRSTSSRSPSAGRRRSGPSGPPASWRSWPRSAPSWPARSTPSSPPPGCPGSSSRRWPTSAS